MRWSIPAAAGGDSLQVATIAVARRLAAIGSRSPRVRAEWSSGHDDPVRTNGRRQFGSVVNVSGWRDSDKEGGTYHANYFRGATEYLVTNWKSEAGGLQGDPPNERFLDLEHDLPEDLAGRFEVVLARLHDRRLCGPAHRGFPRVRRLCEWEQLTTEREFDESNDIV